MTKRCHQLHFLCNEQTRRRLVEVKQHDDKCRDRQTYVSLVTVADDLSVTVVLVTRSSKVASAVGPFWTGTWTTLTTGCQAQHWVTIVTMGTPIKFQHILINTINTPRLE